MKEADTFDQVIETAHDEDVSAWVGAIEEGRKTLGGEAATLVKLQRRSECR